MSKKLAVAIMVKNEIDVIEKTLSSCIDIMDSVIMLDTGSTDGTQQKTKEYCEKKKKPLHLKEEPFVNFAHSKNVLLEFADDKADFILLMDANDELRNPLELLRFVYSLKEPYEIDGFSIMMNLSEKMYNSQTRLLKTKRNWRYIGVVHEYLQKNGAVPTIPIPNVIIYQDRTNDIHKTIKRFPRDRDILEKELIKNPDDDRSIFYLAQTYACMNEYEKSYELYKKRLNYGGWVEEIYYSLFRCGELCQVLNKPWSDSLYYYDKAYQLLPRIEPLIRMANYYKDRNYYYAYALSKLAIDTPFPSGCRLFIEFDTYRIVRHRMMAATGFNVAMSMTKLNKTVNIRTLEPFKEGLRSTMIALKNCTTIEDKKELFNNLKHYDQF